MGVHSCFNQGFDIDMWRLFPTQDTTCWMRKNIDQGMFHGPTEASGEFVTRVFESGMNGGDDDVEFLQNG